jgi:hypothetical protein
MVEEKVVAGDGDEEEEPEEKEMEEMGEGRGGGLLGLPTSRVARCVPGKGGHRGAMTGPGFSRNHWRFLERMHSTSSVDSVEREEELGGVGNLGGERGGSNLRKPGETKRPGRGLGKRRYDAGRKTGPAARGERNARSTLSACRPN